MTDEEPITFSFSLPPEAAKGIVDDIADARDEEQDTWEFTGYFDIENAIEIQASLQSQIQEHELSQEYESYDPED